MVKTERGLVTVGEQAEVRMTFEARRTSGVETGGIIIGCPTSEGFYAHDVLVLPDKNAGYAHFTRDEGTAQEALDDYRATSDDDRLGYIGEWHTHPAPVGPSSTDRNTMNRFGRTFQQPLLLLVVALQPDNDVQFHATITRRLGTRTRPAAVRTEASRSTHVDPQV